VFQHPKHPAGYGLVCMLVMDRTAVEHWVVSWQLTVTVLAVATLLSACWDD